MDYIGDNAAEIDPMEYENEVREKDPRLLQLDEDVVFAFAGRGGKGRDHYMLTTKRVVIRDKKGASFSCFQICHGIIFNHSCLLHLTSSTSQA